MPNNNNNNNNNSNSSKSGSISTSISNKKAKTTSSSIMNSGGDGDTEDMLKKMSNEFRIVREYILACPHVSSFSNNNSKNHPHPAIKAALQGIDQELKRMERDAKLQKKFSTESSSSSLLSTATSNKNAAADADAVMVANPSSMTTTTSTTEKSSTTATKQEDADDQTDDWQDLAAVRSDDVLMMEASMCSGGGDGDGDNNSNQHGAAAAADCNSFLGDRLSAEVIKIIAQQHSVTVTTPLAAIAVALHAAMRSTILGFACTGIPEDEKRGGFAPPVRELPATQLLPPNWDKTTTQMSNGGGGGDSTIALRYRKKGTGSVVLHVVLSTTTTNNNNNNSNTNQTSMVHVTLVPSATAPEPSGESLSFALADHVNLDSFARAASSSSSSNAPSRQQGPGVPPALHYKALSSLLTKFCTTFDLGSVHGDNENGDYSSSSDKNMPYVDTSIQHYPAMAPTTTMKQPQQQPPPKFVKQQFPDEFPPPQFECMVGIPRDPRLYPPTIDSAFPALRDPSSRNGRSGRGGGDFAMDKGLPGMGGAGVLPGGGGGAGGLLGDPMQGGNLMGPNHPMFTGAGGAPANYLVPRYDPVFGPPGGPGDVQDDPNNPLNNNNHRLPRPRGDGKPNFSGNPNPDHFPPPGGCGGHDMFS